LGCTSIKEVKSRHVLNSELIKLWYFKLAPNIVPAPAVLKKKLAKKGIYYKYSNTTILPVTLKI
jgi:hypothetical protein